MATRERDAGRYSVTGPSKPCSIGLLGHSITYRITVGPQAGRKVFILQTLPASDPEDPFGDAVGKGAGFSLHAGVAARADERKKLTTPVPVYQPPGGIREAAVAYAQWQHPLPAEDAVPGRHHACDLRAA